MSEFGGDGGGDALHLLVGKGELLAAEIHIVPLVHGYKVDMGVRHVQADYRYTHFGAGNCLFECFCDLLGEEQQGGIFVVGQVEEIVDLLLGDYQNMARVNRVDIEESEVLVVLGHLVRRDFAGSDT